MRSGKPYLCRAWLLVTRGSLFWIVAVGPEKTAILGLTEGGMRHPLFLLQACDNMFPTE